MQCVHACISVSVQMVLYPPAYIIRQTSAATRTKGQKDPMRTKNYGCLKERGRGKHSGSFSCTAVAVCVYLWLLYSSGLTERGRLQCDLKRR